MFHIRFALLVVLASAGFLLAGCTQTGNPDVNTVATEAGSAAASKTPTPVTLTPEQTKLVQDGVSKLLASPETAKFTSTSAVKLSGAPGIHVCGYVTHKAAGGLVPELPFYVELRNVDGKPIAHRGQVGADDSKKAKVKFVCRHAGKQ